MTNIPLKSDIFPPISPKYVDVRTFVVKISRVAYALLSLNPQVCQDWGIELNPGNASISLLLVKMSRVAFLLTFDVVCQNWGALMLPGEINISQLQGKIEFNTFFF